MALPLFALFCWAALSVMAAVAMERAGGHRPFCPSPRGLSPLQREVPGRGSPHGLCGRRVGAPGQGVSDRGPRNCPFETLEFGVTVRSGAGGFLGGKLGVLSLRRVGQLGL